MQAWLRLWQPTALRRMKGMGLTSAWVHWYRTGKHHSGSQIWQGIVDTIQSHRKCRAEPSSQDGGRGCWLFTRHVSLSSFSPTYSFPAPEQVPFESPGQNLIKDRKVGLGLCSATVYTVKLPAFTLHTRDFNMRCRNVVYFRASAIYC